jgi:Fic family protein
LKRQTTKNEVTNWLLATITAQRCTLARIEFLIDRTKLLDKLEDQLNDKQLKALLRIFEEGPEGFKGAMTAAKYVTIAGARSATTTRHLEDLVNKGALVRTGERSSRYTLAVPLHSVPHISVDKQGELVEE